MKIFCVFLLTLSASLYAAQEGLPNIPQVCLPEYCDYLEDASKNFFAVFRKELKKYKEVLGEDTIKKLLQAYSEALGQIEGCPEAPSEYLIICPHSYASATFDAFEHNLRSLRSLPEALHKTLDSLPEQFTQALLYLFYDAAADAFSSLTELRQNTATSPFDHKHLSLAAYVQLLRQIGERSPYETFFKHVFAQRELKRIKNTCYLLQKGEKKALTQFCTDFLKFED